MNKTASRFLVSLVVVMMLLALVAACSAPTAAPSPTAAPTQAPAAPKATASTQAAAPAQPTAAAAKKVDFPQKGRTITLVVPYPAGGGSDIAVRTLQPYFEKEIGTTVQILNKDGAGSQVGVTEAVHAKPDGYTVGHANWPTIITLYKDPDRKAGFTRKDFQSVAMHVMDPNAISVRADSPIKNIQDLVDAAKKNPNKVSVGTSGLMSPEDFAFRMIQDQAGVKFNIVSFDGAAPGNTALVGGHIDAFGSGISSQLSPAKSGQTRLIATFAAEGRNMTPGLTTMDDQGFKGFFGLTRGWFVPAGTSMDIVNILSDAFKRAEENPEYIQKLQTLGQFSKYMDSQQMDQYWADQEKFVAPLVTQVKAANQ